LLGSRPVWFDAAAPTPTPVYARAALQPGNRLGGPALVLQYDATVVITPGWSGHVDTLANLWLEREDAA
ncbi:MAG: hypothetical protein R6X34_02910, partial [Chloroflexota bacterium]